MWREGEHSSREPGVGLGDLRALVQIQFMTQRGPAFAPRRERPAHGQICTPVGPSTPILLTLVLPEVVPFHSTLANVNRKSDNTG